MIKRMERVDDTMHIIAQGTERIKVISWKQEEPYLRAVVQILPRSADKGHGRSRSDQAQCSVDGAAGAGVAAGHSA